MELRGVGNTITAKQFPAVVQDLTVAVRMCFPPGEHGKHDLAMYFVDSSDEVLGPPAIQNFVASGMSPDLPAWTSALIGFPPVRFAAPGVFRLLLDIDEQEVAICTLIVEKK
jgi:hypothetical protein